MKEQELRDIATCALCKQPFGHAGLPIFYRVRIEQHGVDLKAIRRQDGLAAYMGSPLLAQVMGPDQEMTKLLDARELTVCQDCALLPQPLLMMLEAAPEPKCKSCGRLMSQRPECTDEDCSNLTDKGRRRFL